MPQNEEVLATIRLIQWEQAKAHLAGMLHTYSPVYEPNGFSWLSNEITNFIQKIEGGL